MCLVFQFSSCIKEVNVAIPQFPKKVVINSLFCPDSILKIHVSLSEGIESDIQIVENAQIRLYENDIFIQNISYLSKGWYSSNYYPKAGMKYKIDVNIEGYDIVTAESLIPENPLISAFTCQLLEGFDLDWGSHNSNVKLIFKDFENYSNFYELSFFSFLDNVNSAGLADSPVMNHMSDLSILADSELEFKPNQFFFSDNLFNGLEKTVFLNYLGGTYIDPVNNVIKNSIFYALFKTVSPEYYNFRKSWTKHVYNQDTDIHNDDPIVLLFKGDPIEMYTNVNGGYGIFAGYNQQYKEVVYIP